MHDKDNKLLRLIEVQSFKAEYLIIGEREYKQKASKQKWREPSNEQLALEKRFTLLIAKFIRQGYLDHDLFFTFSLISHGRLVQETAIILQQAHVMGVSIGQGMVGVQERAIGDVAKGWIDKARDMVNGIVDRVRELISDALDDGGDDATIAQDAVDHAIEQVPDLIAETEIPTAIEDGVMNALQQGDVARVVWVVSPGACTLCMANADYGPVALGSAFPGGQTQAPAHPRCRCNVVPAESE